MAFNMWPFTNLHDLNIDWLLRKLKVIESEVDTANENANTALRVTGDYAADIQAANNAASAANAAAQDAVEAAQEADRISIVYVNASNKAVEYEDYIAGSSNTLSADDIYTNLIVNHRLPILMNRQQYVYNLAGYETDPANPLVINRFKFNRYGGNGRESIAFVDRNADVTFTYADMSGGGGYTEITFEYYSGQGGTGWRSSKTYQEIRQLLNDGEQIALIVKYLGDVRDIIFNAQLRSGFIQFGYSNGLNSLGLTNVLTCYTINSSEVITEQYLYYLPASGTIYSGYILTVDSQGKPAWAPPSSPTPAQNVQEIVWGSINNSEGNFTLVISDPTPQAVDGSDVMDYLSANPKKLPGFVYLNRVYLLSGSDGTNAVFVSNVVGTVYYALLPLNGYFVGFGVVSSSAGESIVESDDTSVQDVLSPNTFYIYGVIDQISVSFATPSNPNIVNEYHFRFETGSGSELYLPNGVMMPDDFDPANLDDYTVYEISVVGGYLAYMKWYNADAAPTVIQPVFDNMVVNPVGE